jgi:predicted DNA-binding transcriptional regulator YafY
MTERGDGNRQAGALLKFIVCLQADRFGRTVTELMQEMECSRRTVLRLLEELRSWDLVERKGVRDSDHHLTKRYSLVGALPASMLALRGPDIASLNSLLDGLPSGSERQALSKLLAAQNLVGVSASIDQETLIERVSYLGRVGPKTTISQHILTTIETAIQGFECLSLVYQTPHRGKTTARTVEPLGLIYSRFGYLVAREGQTVKTFRFELIEEVEKTGEFFDAQGFNLKEWAGQSFGVFHGDAIKTWKITFSPKVAARAASVQFHPSEKKTLLPDGSLQLTLRCRGERELRYELDHPDWAGNVSITTL